MGNPKQKWTAEEEEALRAGVAKHGTGKWKDIQRDPEFNQFLFSRSNIDLKDKWRNMIGGGSGQGARDKSRTVKAKLNQDVPPAAVQTPSAPAQEDPSIDAALDGGSKGLEDGKSGPKYNAMIFEALSTLKEPNGSDLGAIFNYIERRHEVPTNFRRLLSSKLRRLSQQEKLEKVGNYYKLKDDSTVNIGIKSPAVREKEVRPRPPQATAPTVAVGESIEAAAVAAAYRIAEAENKAFLAAEAVKEAERVSKMLEDAESMLLFSKEILDRCLAEELVFVA